MARKREKTPEKPPEKPVGGLDVPRLEALRDRLAAVIDDPSTSPRDLAGVSREYRIVVERLAAARPPSSTSALDEIARRREKRGA